MDKPPEPPKEPPDDDGRKYEKPDKEPPGFDLGKGEKRKTKGMARAWNEANEEWKRTALIGYREIARHKEFLSSDDIKAWMLKNYPNVTTPNPKVMGSLMRMGPGFGYAKKVGGETVKSRRALAHAREIGVWESLIYEGERRMKKAGRRRRIDPNQLDFFPLMDD